MADRKSAEIFGSVFTHLAEQPDERNRTLARWLWGMTSHYDFNDYQMYCDDALLALGLARRGEDGDIRYGPEQDDAP